MRLAAMVDGFFQSPVVSVKAVKNQYGISYPTAKSDLKKLQAMGIVEPLEGMDLMTYYCPTIYKLTYEDVP